MAFQKKFFDFKVDFQIFSKANNYPIRIKYIPKELGLSLGIAILILVREKVLTCRSKILRGGKQPQPAPLGVKSKGMKVNALTFEKKM